MPANPTLQAAERDHILRALREAKGMIGGPDGAADAPRPQAHHPQLQNQKARHRAQRIYVSGGPRSARFHPPH